MRSNSDLPRSTETSAGSAASCGDWRICILLVLATFAVFWPVAGYQFITFDDPVYITDNPLVKNGLTWEGVRWAFGTVNTEATYFHPLTWIAHMVVCQVFGTAPAAHHVVNLVLHSVNVLLLFLLLRRSTGSLWRSALVAAVFAWHPMQVNTVAWVTELKNVLSTMFWLLTGLAYLHYVTRPSISRYLLVATFFALGLLAKPMLVTLPLWLLLLDYWPLRRMRLPNRTAIAEEGIVSKFHRSNLRSLVLEKLPLLGISALSCVVTMLAVRGIAFHGNHEKLPFRLCVENAFVGYVRYVRNFLFPNELAVHYPHPGKWPFVLVLISVLVLAAITIEVIRRHRQQPYLAIGWFWFAGILFPVSGVIQSGGQQAMADRFAYVPIIGLAVMAIWGGADWLLRHRKFPAMPGLAAVVLLTILAAACRYQLGFWKDSITLFERTVAVTNNNSLAYHNLALAYHYAGHTQKAATAELEAVRLAPDMADWQTNAGIYLVRAGRPEEAFEHYRRSIELNPDNLPWLLGMVDRRIANRSFKEAEDHLRLIVRLSPENVDARSGLALALEKQRKTPEAVAEYTEALRLEPNHLATLQRLAWLRATHPDERFRNGIKAVELAERAVRMTQGKDAQCLLTLAAACGEAGSFYEALKFARQTEVLARSQGLQDLLQLAERMSSDFADLIPFHEQER